MKLTPLASNMTEITLSDKRILFSYETPVAYQDLDTVGTYYKTVKKWSTTTTRHISKWLGGNAAKLVSQDYLDDLVK
jgi:hypothetical protein